MVGVSISLILSKRMIEYSQEHFSRRFDILVYWWLQFVMCIWNPREDLHDHLSAILKILKCWTVKKMLTEEKPRILHLLTVTTNPGL